MIAPSRRRRGGFTLVELAVVLAIVGLLLGSLMYTLSAQVERRDFEETRRRLEQARELVLTFAMINGRLPCPARNANTLVPATVTGDEVRSAAGQCIGDAVEDYYGGTSAGPPVATLGFLPARTIGVQQVDSEGFAVDAWGNRLRYVVAKTKTNCVPAVAPNVLLDPHFVQASNLKNNGIACQPNDLLICKSATGITATACGGAANQLMSQSLVVAIIYSTGKNATSVTGGTGLDEAANLNGDPVFVYHTPAPSDAANGEFDDQFVWITVGELYGKLIAAGQLP